MKKSKSIQQMFNNIAKNYDKLNQLITLGQHLKIKKKAIKNIPIQNTYKILDVCTGTGDIAIHIAKNIATKGYVTGVDFSTEMLEIAQKKSKNIENINFSQADALNLPFNDETFDVSIISFGLRNVENIEKTLLEMKRVTKKSGYIINLDTGKPYKIIEKPFNFYFFKIVPLLGNIINKDDKAYKYLPNSTKEFPSQTELVKLFKKLGLKNIRNYNFLFGTIAQQIGEV